MLFTIIGIIPHGETCLGMMQWWLRIDHSALHNIVHSALAYRRASTDV